jgi:cell division transport system permease protein
MARELSANMVVTFFLDPGASPRDTDALERTLRESRLVSEVHLVDSAQALDRFQRSFPELKDILASIQTNPFPPSLEARLTGAASTAGEVAAFVREIRGMKGVQDVQFNQDWVEKMRALSRLAKAVGFFLGGILILASFFIISNVIKLNVLARKNEIEILRLVGATNTFIRIPFLLEGMALGILGSLVSLAFLFLTIRLFPLYVGSLGALQQILNFRYLSFSQTAGLIAAGAGIGLMGSATSVARFLKV